MSCNIHVLKSTNEETNGLKRKNQYAIVPRFSSVSVSVPVNTETAQTSESSSWGQQTEKCPCCTKWNVPLTLGPVRGRHCTPSLSLTVHELVCCEQWGCNPISVGSLGRPVCERAGRQRPSLLTEAPVSQTGPLTDQHRWIQMRNAVGGLATLMSGHNGPVCFTDPMSYQSYIRTKISLIHHFFLY